MDDELDWVPVKRSHSFNFAETVAFATIYFFFGVYVGGMVVAFVIQ